LQAEILVPLGKRRHAAETTVRLHMVLVDDVTQHQVDAIFKIDGRRLDRVLKPFLLYVRKRRTWQLVGKAAHHGSDGAFHAALVPWLLRGAGLEVDVQFM